MYDFNKASLLCGSARCVAIFSNGRTKIRVEHYLYRAATSHNTSASAILEESADELLSLAQSDVGIHDILTFHSSSEGYLH